MDSKLWTDMFVLAVPVLEKIVRPIIIYAALIIGLRLAGKRELAQLNPFDLVVLLTLSNTVQNAIIGEDNTITGGLIGAATLLLLNFVVVRFVYRSRKIEQLVEGEEDVLIEAGKLQKKAMESEAISIQDLTMAAHKQGFSSLREVERAVLEPGGGITFSGRQSGPLEKRHREVLARLDALSGEVAALRHELGK
jgi:uncharacterized membrane protein YcaP (DUF421 family)